MKRIKRILCLIFGHKWDHWIWNEDPHYGMNQCVKCLKIIWSDEVKDTPE